LRFALRELQFLLSFIPRCEQHQQCRQALRLLAHRAVFATVKRLGVVPDLDESLHAAVLKAEQKMNAKYDAPLENALKKN
jgi:hypothetical protein